MVLPSQSLRLIRVDATDAVGTVADETLMVRLMDGDIEAFDELYGRHGTRIRTFIERFTGDPEAADDLVQEVFLKVYRNPKLFDPRGRFLTWIYAVARNACIDFLRVRRLPTISTSGGSSDDDAPSYDPPAPAHARPLEQTLDSELREQIGRLATKLSPKLREVFILCAVQGLSYEDAAAVIGCPVKTVSSRLSRARDRFMQEFSRYWDDARPESA
jgi:RNA polymerase sigma-70 factor, ECF subfamily